MTYIELINHFWDVDLEHSYSAYEAKLYFAILQIANRLRWKEPLSIPNGRLTAMVRCDKKTFIKARQRLIDTHLINYKSASTRKAGKYWWNISTNNGTNRGTNHGTNHGTNLGTNDGTNAEPRLASTVALSPYVRIRLDKDIEKDSTRKKHAKKADEIIALYHETCVDLPKVKLSSKTRNAFIESRWKEHPNRQFFKEFFEKVKASDFLSGKITSFRADLEWLMRPSNFVKVVEGKYDNREVKNGKNGSRDSQHDDWLEKFKNPAGHTITDEDVEALILRPNKARSA